MRKKQEGTECLTSDESQAVIMIAFGRLYEILAITLMTFLFQQTNLQINFVYECDISTF